MFNENKQNMRICELEYKVSCLESQICEMEKKEETKPVHTKEEIRNSILSYLEIHGEINIRKMNGRLTHEKCLKSIFACIKTVGSNCHNCLSDYTPIKILVYDYNQNHQCKAPYCSTYGIEKLSRVTGYTIDEIKNALFK